MFTRRTSWLLVSVQWERGNRLWIPVPIWAMAEVLRGLGILLWCFPGLSRLAERRGWSVMDKLGHRSVKELAFMGLDFIEKVRRYGPFTLVEMASGETAVSIRFV